MGKCLQILSCAFLICLLLGGTSVMADSVPDDVEFALLKKMYDSLGGASWTKKTNWPSTGNWPTSATSTQFAAWYGITVVNGDISKIVMANNKLVGKLPSNIGDLKGLTVLDLNTNATLAGKIPGSLSTISSLQQILLYRCALTGTIPTSITSLTALTSLRLEDNKLTGSIPANIGNLTSLTQLFLFDNALSGVLPGSLGNLVNLKDLQLYTNGFTGSIPSSLGNLTKLQTLRLDANQLTGSIPAALGSLTNLTILYLFKNQLSGPIPYSLGNLTNLIDLQLYSNALTGSIPASLGNLHKLQYFHLHTNRLSGSLPKELGDLSALLSFYVANNELTGSIPATFDKLTSMVNFYAQGNRLSGSLPASLGSLYKLRYFYVYDNELSGGIPAEYSNLSELLGFYVYDNQLSGSLATGLMAKWTKIQLLNLSNNKFTGEFPSSVGNCAVLTSLVANGNQFTTMPVGLLTLGTLAVANFSDNELVTVPDFSNHANARNLTLNLSKNRLDFSVFGPLMVTAFKSLVVSPQKNISDVTALTPVLNSPLSVPARSPGLRSKITWEKQQLGGSWVNVASTNEDTSSKTYFRTAFALGDEGVYRWSMTDSAVAGLTIVSDPIAVRSAQSFALDNWAFQYKYDGRRRVIGKKVPGADWVYMIYDERDRLVMTQDGIQRQGNMWTCTLYDVLNRPVITGIYTHSAYVDRDSMSVLVNSSGLNEKYTGETRNHGYTSTVFSAPKFIPDNFDVQTVTYYDNYEFMSGWGNEFAYASKQVESKTIAGVTYVQLDLASTRIKDQVTGVKVKSVEDQPYWLYTANYYDDQYRLIQSISDNLRGGFDRTTNLYDFESKVLESKTSHVTGKLTWNNLVAVKVDGDNLLKNTTTAGWGNSGASSMEAIDEGADGWVETTVNDITTARVFGLSENDTDQNFTSMKYAFYLSGANLSVYLDGGKTIKYSVPGGEAVGDRLRIERKNGSVSFYKNGLKIYPLSGTLTSSSRLLADISLFHNGSSVRYSRISTGHSLPQAVTRRFKYDHGGRLLETWHKVNDAAWVLLSQNEYNELGQVVDKKLHNTDPENADNNSRKFKQSIDYRYNIRGWLTSINNSTLVGNTVDNDDSADCRDLFGIEMGYDKSLDTNNKSYFNGNISAIKWSNSLGLGDAKENAYNFEYDSMNRIRSADFIRKKLEWGVPDYKDDDGEVQTAKSFTETGYDYDLNGNLKTLTRKGVKGVDMDVLTYNYGTGATRSNKLLAVTDEGEKQVGFVDGNETGDDYTYNNNGSLSSDKNKSIASISYSYLNLPKVVTKTSGEYIKYIYDATGRKLRQEVYSNANVRVKKTDYVGEHFYENDTLKFLNHEEGRAVIAASTPEYQYFMKDHLGNVRLTFTTKYQLESASATLETVNSVGEEGQFLNYNEAVKVNADLFDHTQNGKPSSPDRTYYSIRLGGENANRQEKYGLAKSLSVMPGDTIKMEVFAKYIDLAASNAWQSSLNNLMNSINDGTAQLSGTFIDGGVAGSLGGGVFPYIELLKRENDNGDGPKAYLNWLIFDRDFNYLDGGFSRVSKLALEDGTETKDHERLAASVTVKEAGYVYIYLSNENENPVDVFFDDFKVDHAKGPVMQLEDYYPFGATFNSYRREGSVPQDFLYQEKGWQRDLDLDLYDFEWRQYDPFAARTTTTDPHADGYPLLSPYSWAANNPLSIIDPDGQDIINTSLGTTYTGADAQNMFSQLQARSSSTSGNADPGKSTFYSFNSRTQARRERTDKDQAESEKESQSGIIESMWNATKDFGGDLVSGELFSNAWKTISNYATDYPNSMLRNLEYQYKLGQGEIPANQVAYDFTYSAWTTAASAGIVKGIGGAARFFNFGFNGGYGVPMNLGRLGKLEFMYRNPSVRGGTIFSYKSVNGGKFRLDYHSFNARGRTLHFHSNYNGYSLSTHRTLNPFRFGQAIK